MLDTSTLISIFRGNKEALLRADLTPVQDLVTSSLVIAELSAGMQGNRKTSTVAQLSESFMKFATVTAFDRAAALEAGYLLDHLAKAGKPIGHIDTLIAAHAKSMNAVLVTSNVKHFSRVPGLKVEDWSKK